VRVLNNTGFQNLAVGVTSTSKISRGCHVGIIRIKTERRNQVVISEAPGLNLDWELDYYSSVVFLIPSGQMPGLFLNVGYDHFLPQLVLVVFTVGGPANRRCIVVVVCVVVKPRTNRIPLSFKFVTYVKLLFWRKIK
jgi:hypothetical protein